MQTAFAHVHGFDIEATPATSHLRNFIQSELPEINSAIEMRSTTERDLVTRVRPLLAAVREEATISRDHLDRDDARRILQLIGFVISSVERHFQANGEEPGVGKEMVGPTDELLLMLGDVGEHPPRDTDTTYWYLNQDCRLSFTGDSQEAHFNRVVNLQRQVQSEACVHLRPICDGIVDALCVHGVRSMLEAAEGLERLIEGYRTFMEPVNGGYRFSPDFFMRRMRTYLVGYPVGGRLLSGPNAANLAANMSLDYLTGLTAPWYVDVVRSRWQYLVNEDQRDLVVDMARPSLTDRVIETMGLDSQTILKFTLEELAQQITSQPKDVRSMLRAYASVVEPVSHATGIHFRLIHEYLIRNAAKLSSREYEALPVKPNQGTGQMSHEHTRNIMEMRRKHPIVSKLLAANRVLENADHRNEHVIHTTRKGENSCPRNTR